MQICTPNTKNNIIIKTIKRCVVHICGGIFETTEFGMGGTKGRSMNSMHCPARHAVGFSVEKRAIRPDRGRDE
jgi:hypothetical protein